jgi:hypothetical protein
MGDMIAFIKSESGFESLSVKMSILLQVCGHARVSRSGVTALSSAVR